MKKTNGKHLSLLLVGKKKRPKTHQTMSKYHQQFGKT